MSTMTNQIPSLYIDRHSEIGETATERNEPTLVLAPRWMEWRTLRGYFAFGNIVFSGKNRCATVGTPEIVV